MFEMRRPALLAAVASLLGLAVFTPPASAIEEPAFEVVTRYDGFEVRRYDAFVVAEVMTGADFEGAGNQAFDTLFGYISGENRGSAKMAMTAPVLQEGAGEKMDMTAPVLQRSAADAAGQRVSFVLPATYDMDSAPAPTDPRVELREVPGRTVAAIEYSGFWSESNYREHEQQLRELLRARGWEPVGPPEWARYNAPFVPWFLRRNEVLIPVRESARTEAGVQAGAS